MSQPATPPASPDPQPSPSPTPEPAKPPEATPTPSPTDPAAKPSLINGDPKPGDPKPGEGDKPPAPAPLTADDFKDLPNFKADDPFLGEFLGVMNKADMSPKDRSAALLQLQTKLMNDLSEKGQQAFTQMQEDWRTQTIALPEFANGKLEPALGGISKLVERFGDAETRQAFDLTGAGNHPAIVRFLHKVALQLNEPGVDPAKPNPGPKTDQDRAAILYPSS